MEQFLSPTTELIDMDGKVVHSGAATTPFGGGCYVLPNGDFLRSVLIHNSPFNNSCPGLSGRVELLDWDGKFKWGYTCAESTKSLHHDVYPLPNGNILMVGVEAIGQDRQLAMGRDPARVTKDLWLDFLIELKPYGTDGAEIVWEWHLSDHLIQEFDKSKNNCGVVSDHPELLDLNVIENLRMKNAATLRNLQSIGYVGQAPAATPQGGGMPDWTHVNSISYNAKLDQILLSVRSLSEIWIVDHSAVTQEAVGHKGGKSGKGGDLIYRWGNPQLYQRGLAKEQILFGQHNADWVPEGSPGAGNIMMFNNGEGRKDGAYSTIEEITPPLNKDGSYQIEDGSAYGPTEVAWHYESKPNKTDFASTFLSGVQRLPNGDTVICSGIQGKMFEVTMPGDIVWEQDCGVVRANGDQKGPGAAGGTGAKGPGGRRPGPGGAGAAGPGAAGAAPQRPARGGNVAMIVSSATLSGTGQVSAFGTFEFLKAFATISGQQRRGAGGPGAGTGTAPALVDPAAVADANQTPAPGGPVAGGRGRRGAGGPRAGSGTGGPIRGSTGHGAIFRAVRYGLDYPAFKGRDLTQSSTSAPVAAVLPKEGG